MMFTESLTNMKSEIDKIEEAFNQLVSELLLNFADGRIQEGNVFIIIEDIDDGLRKRLEDRHINCITQKSITDFLFPRQVKS